MYNDSLDTLLLRHYGPTAPTPVSLEQRLLNSVRQEAMTQPQKEASSLSRVLTYRMNRRRAMKFVFLGSAGLGVLGAGLEVLDAALFGAPTTQSSKTISA